MNEKILKIRQQLTEIKSITLENMQINFGKENIIVIKINNKKDISKWDYFCERLSRQCDSVHIIKKYPEIPTAMQAIGYKEIVEYFKRLYLSILYFLLC